MEIAKLVVAMLTPLSVALVGVVLALSTRRFEHSRWLNQKLIEKRIELLSEALPRLNDLYCYFCWVGGWVAFAPSEILQHKRDLDRLFHAHQAFFTQGAVAAYLTFAETLFRTYAAPGTSAQLRTSMVSIHGDRSSVYPHGDWQRDWDVMFAEEADRSDPDTVEKQYKELVIRLGVEVGVAYPDGAADDRAVVL